MTYVRLQHRKIHTCIHILSLSILGISPYFRKTCLSSENGGAQYCLRSSTCIPRSSLNIPRLSWENLARQSRNSQSELNGTTKLTLDFRFSACSRERGVFCVIFLTFTIDQAVYMRISEKILHIVCKITMPNAELFAINPNRMMMI